jgi:hypothetical protein
LKARKANHCSMACAPERVNYHRSVVVRAASRA